MKTRYFTIAAGLIVMMIASLGISFAEDQVSTTEKIIVTVNGTAITQADINAEMQQKLAGATGKMPPEQLAQVKTRMQEKVVDNFIAKTVLAKECDNKKISITPQEVDDALAEMSKGLPEGMTLEDALKAGQTSLDAIKKDIAFGLRVNKLIDANVQIPKPPSEKDIKTFYEQNTKAFEGKESVDARHILIKSSKEEDKKIRDEKRARADELHKQLVNGADFAEVASKNSDCPSKNQGGNLGTFQRGRMVKGFEDAAFSQKVDEIGPVVETRFGYHIIQVTAHNSASQKSFIEVKDQIKKHLEQNNKNMAVRKYIEGLKEKATIVYTKK